MSNRITMKDLERDIDRLNIELFGSDQISERDENNHLRWFPNRYVLDAANGGYKLNRICKDGHGESSVSEIRQNAKGLSIVIRSILDVIYHQRKINLLNL